MGQMTISRERRGYLSIMQTIKLAKKKLYLRLSPSRYHSTVNQGLTIAHKYQFPPTITEIFCQLNFSGEKTNELGAPTSGVTVSHSGEG